MGDLIRFSISLGCSDQTDISLSKFTGCFFVTPGAEGSYCMFKVCG